jgi:hypothetical protein
VTFSYLWALFGRMCGTIDPGSCIRWVLDFGLKLGMTPFARLPQNWNAWSWLPCSCQCKNTDIFLCFWYSTHGQISFRTASVLRFPAATCNQVIFNVGAKSLDLMSSWRIQWYRLPWSFSTMSWCSSYLRNCSSREIVSIRRVSVKLSPSFNSYVADSCLLMVIAVVLFIRSRRDQIHR